MNEEFPDLSDRESALIKSLEDFGSMFQEAMDLIEKDSEDYWNGLSKDDQLKAFCAVSRRIYQGEILDKGSYRHVLYGVFGFGPKAYATAQAAGYLDIHNAIVTEDDKKDGENET